MTERVERVEFAGLTLICTGRHTHPAANALLNVKEPGVMSHAEFYCPVCRRTPRFAGRRLDRLKAKGAAAKEAGGPAEEDISYWS